VLLCKVHLGAALIFRSTDMNHIGDSWWQICRPT